MGSLSPNSQIANSTVITFNPQAGATYTPQAGDSNKVITLSNAGGCTVTMPNPTVVGPGFHFWLEARNNAPNLVQQFAAEKFFMNGVALAGVNNFNLSPAALQTTIGWDDVVHIACDGTNWHVIQGGPNAANALALAAVSLTGTLTPAQVAGIVGTTTNNDAQAGSIGEQLETVIASGSGINIFNATPVTIATLALTAGDWDVFGQCGFTAGVAVPVQYLIATPSLVTNTLGATADFSAVTYSAAGQNIFGGTDAHLPLIPTRFKIGVGGANVFMVAQAGLPVSAITGYGRISARRRR